jgi:hypothetical protein
MKVRFLADAPNFGTKNKPAKLSLQTRSPYYWWWVYLRRNEDYLRCCENGGKGKFAKLYKDFGDVRGDDFKKWWKEKGVELFSEKHVSEGGDMVLMELTDKSQWNESWTSDKVLVVAMPLTSSKRYLQSRFNALLKKRHTTKRGRHYKTFEESSAKYPLAKNYTIRNLETTLAVYDEYLKHKGQVPKVPYWKIGQNMRLVPSAMTTESMSMNERHVYRNVMGASVKRYIVNAENMIKNVAQGKFPASTKVV